MNLFIEYGPNISFVWFLKYATCRVQNAFESTKMTPLTYMCNCVGEASPNN